MVTVIESGLQLVVDELLKVVAAQSLQIARSKTLINRIENTLESIEPVLDRPLKGIILFNACLKRGKMVVLKSSRFFQTELQIKTVNSMINLIGIDYLEEKLDQLLADFTTHVSVDSSLCCVLGLQVLIVGFNSNLEELKSTDTQVLSIVKECFMVLDSIHEDERITSDSCFMQVSCSLQSELRTLFWMELSNLDDEGMHILQLSSRNLINLVPVRNELIAEQKRLFMEIDRDEFPTCWIKQIAQPINPCVLSLSTGFISSNWYDQIAPKVEELTLDIRSETYSLPEFIKQMNQLKVLSIRSHCDYPSKLHNLSFIEGLSNLRSIRFEHVLVPSMQPIFALKNLNELSFVMCEINDALMSCTTESPYMLPNLTNLEIDMCYDLKELPSALCNLVHLQKLTITNCHELEVLPKGIGSLSNLEILSLHCCTKLQELPTSIGSLHNLSCIDISDCLSISLLPEETGELFGLRVLKMNGCGGLQQLPMSISKLQQLEEVICDEETSYLWMDVESDLPNLKIDVVEDDRLDSFMKIVQ